MRKENPKKQDECREQIEHFLDGKFTRKEFENIKTWYTQPKFRFKLQKTLEKIWINQFSSETDEKDKVDLENVRNRIHRRINIQRSIDVHRFSFRKTLVSFVSKAAAILFIPLLILSTLYIHRTYIQPKRDPVYTEINVPQGSKLKTQLPDGSVVWINSGSTLRYPQTFSKRHREAEIRGEAYFDIRPDASHPFVVHTGTIDFNVLGTSFNVMAYPEEDNITATLEEGIISVERHIPGKKGERFFILDEGERVVYNKKQKNIDKYKTSTEKYTSWKDGKLIFRNDPLHVVIDRLKKWYSADIVLADSTKGLPDHPFTITIEHETLPQVLDYLSIASPISWSSVPTRRSETGHIITSKYIISPK